MGSTDGVGGAQRPARKGRNALRPYWFPKGRAAPQSGQVHQMLLHVMPQRFSSMQAWQIWKPHGQVQQKSKVLLQQQHR